MEIIHHEIGRDALYKVWNTADENMIICFFSDGGSIVFQDGIYPIERGSICFVGRGKLHYTVPDEPATYDRSKIFLPEKETRSLVAAVPKQTAFSALFSEKAVVYAKLPSERQNDAERLFQIAEQAALADREASAVASFFSLMCLLSEYKVHHIKAPETFMTRAIEYVNEHYSEEITLSALCRAVNMSRSHFCREFKRAMGITVMEYVLNTRIAAAKTLLAASDLSVSQIAARCGFSGISYFCQVFKERVGMTAKQLRARESPAES